jgi:PAS domain S-box-containing protein
MNAPADRGECFDPLTNQRDEEGLRLGQGRMEETLRSALEFRERFMEASSNAIGALDAGGRVVLANRRLAEITGYSLKELIGRSFQTMAAPDELARIDYLVTDVLKNGVPASQVETEMLREDGETRTVNLSLRPLQLEDGGPGIFVTAEDITERKREEGALKESEMRLRRDIEALLQTVGAIIWQGEADILAKTFHFDFVSQQAERFLGYPVTDWLKNPPIWIEHLHPKDRRRVLATRNQALARRRDYEIEYRMIARDGRTMWLREIVKVELANDHQLKLRGIAIDITERKQADAALHESDERNKAILTALPDLMFLTSKEGLLLDYHVKEWDQLFDSPELLHGKNISEVLPPELAEALARCFEEATETGEPVIHEYSLQLDGGIGYYEARVVGCGSGRALTIVRDITERKRAEEALRESQQRLAMATAAGGVGIWDYDLGTGEIYIDPALKTILGFADHEIRNHIDDWVKHIHPEDRERVLANLEVYLANEPPACEFEHRLLHKDGSVRWFLARGTFIRLADETPYRLVGTQTDITDRKRAEEALRNIAEGVSAVTGESFLRSLVQYLVKILGVNYALVGELVEPEREIVKAIACADGVILDDFEYRLADSPCESVVKQQLCCHYEDAQRLLFKDELLAELAVESYLGTPLMDSSGRTLGLLVVMNRKPLADRKLATSMLKIFAARASAEIERKLGEAALLASEESLRRSHARVQDLAGKLITAQEEERKHLSRELHDDLNQKLASLAITIGYLKRHLPEPADFINRQLTDLEDRIFALSNDIRQLSHDLHPAVLEHIGLHMALESYCAEFSRREGIRVALDIKDGITDIQPRVALCLYRIAQEALRNIAKHSGAGSANVTLSTANGGVRLIISDKGVGYDYSLARTKGGLGLISMEERVRLLGGSFHVLTQPQKGTEVSVQIPNQ